MLERGRISDLQTIYLLVNVVGATAMVFLPALTAEIAGRDAWLAPVLATLPGIYVAFLVGALGRRFPGRTLVEYLPDILGKFPGKAVGALYLFFFLHINGIIVREFGELVAAAILPRTPQVVLGAAMVSLCAYAIAQGLEVLARVVELTYPFILGLFAVVLLLAARHMDPAALLPFLENGFKPIFLSSLNPGAWRGEIVLLAMFLPYLARPGRGTRNAVLAVLIIGMILAIDDLAITTIFTVSAGRLTYPTLELVRIAGAGQFLQRLDALWLAIWIAGMFGKVGLFHYCTVLGTAQWLGLKNYRVLLVPLSILLIAFSLTQFENTVQVTDWIVKVYPPYAYLIEWGIPTGLLLVVWVKKKGKRDLKTG